MTVLTVSGVLHYVGLSSDDKPTTGVPAGSTFLELTLDTPNTVAKWIYDGAEWGVLDAGVDISAVIPSIDTLLLIPNTATGTAVIDETLANWTGAQDLITIVPATGSPLVDAYVDIDLAKATSGFAALYTSETLTLQVSRKVDGTNWRKEPALTAISGTAAALRMIRIPLGTVSVAEDVKITATLSAESGGGTAVVDLPFVLHYVAAEAPTVTAAEAA